MFWIAAFIICAVFFIGMARPLIKRNAAQAENPDDRAEALSAVLTQIDEDRAAGLIGETEAQEAALEAKHAALATPSTRPREKASKTLRFTSVAFLALTPVLAAVIYFTVGAPDALKPSSIVAAPMPAPMTPGAIASMAPEERAAAIRNMVAGLSARLEENPEDVEGWRMLARSYGVLNEPEKSIEAWRALLKRTPGAREDLREFTLALVRVHGEGGDEAGELAAVLEATLQRFPGDAIALYQLGALYRANGAPQRALVLWRDLLAALPQDAPIRPTLESLVAEAETEAAAQ